MGFVFEVDLVIVHPCRSKFCPSDHQFVVAFELLAAIHPVHLAVRVVHADLYLAVLRQQIADHRLPAPGVRFVGYDHQFPFYLSAVSQRHLTLLSVDSYAHCRGDATAQAQAFRQPHPLLCLYSQAEQHFAILCFPVPAHAHPPWHFPVVVFAESKLAVALHCRHLQRAAGPFKRKLQSAVRASVF
ncbi:MAG: hypothetical protein JPMHGGIA_00984 [Saprospiraceae bacterium]|nr:hypothetical protein [Saprospiraceae bacterium]